MLEEIWEGDFSVIERWKIELFAWNPALLKK